MNTDTRAFKKKNKLIAFIFQIGDYLFISSPFKQFNTFFLVCLYYHPQFKYKKYLSGK